MLSGTLLWRQKLGFLEVTGSQSSLLSRLRPVRALLKAPEEQHGAFPQVPAHTQSSIHMTDTNSEIEFGIEFSFARECNC